MKNFLKTLKRNAKGLALAASAAGVSVPIALAEDNATDKVIGKILDVVTQLFFYIGIVLACWSIGMLILAFKNEDADSKSRAIMLLVVSVSLIGIKLLIGPILSVIPGAEGIVNTMNG